MRIYAIIKLSTPESSEKYLRFFATKELADEAFLKPSGLYGTVASDPARYWPWESVVSSIDVVDEATLSFNSKIDELTSANKAMMLQLMQAEETIKRLTHLLGEQTLEKSNNV